VADRLAKLIAELEALGCTVEVTQGTLRAVTRDSALVLHDVAHATPEQFKQAVDMAEEEAKRQVALSGEGQRG
jgi:hypothetical protein